MNSYGSLCTEFYDLDKPDAPPEAFAFYLSKARGAQGKVLEPMCGSGRFLIPMAREGIVIDGTDSSEPMLVACRRRLAEVGLHANVFEQSIDALDLPSLYALAFVPSGSIGLLPTLEMLQAALAGIRRHLLPGASFYFEITEPDQTTQEAQVFELAPRSVVSTDGAIIKYSASVRPTGDAGGAFIHGQYEKRLNDQVVMVEDEEIIIRSYTRSEIYALLRGSGFNDIKCYSSADLSFLHESGCLLIEAR